jgi:hypothetical protein
MKKLLLFSFGILTGSLLIPYLVDRWVSIAGTPKPCFPDGPRLKPSYYPDAPPWSQASEYE